MIIAFLVLGAVAAVVAAGVLGPVRGLATARSAWPVTESIPTYYRGLVATH